MTNPVSNNVLQEILEKTRLSSGMYVQKVYKETLRDLISIFSNVYYIDRNNNPIKVTCFHANQERAIAKIRAKQNITLPVISVGETTSANSDARRRYSPILVHDVIFDKKKNRAIRLLSMAPRPVDIDYQINIWATYKQDLDQLREYVFLMFNPDLEIKTKDSIMTKAFLLSESEAGNQEADDTKDRILQKSLTIRVETYLPNPKFLYTSTGKIEEFNYDLEIDETLD
jgi:hypothetical protein